MKGGRKTSEQTGVCLALCSVLASGIQKKHREEGADDARPKLQPSSLSGALDPLPVMPRIWAFSPHLCSSTVNEITQWSESESWESSR